MTGLPYRSTTERQRAPTSASRLPLASGSGAGFIDVQLQSLCRICASAGDSMVDIYDHIFAEDYRPALDQWINDYLPINVTQIDTLPLKVCTKCSQILLAFHQLYLCCLESKQRFDAMLVVPVTASEQPAQQEPPDRDEAEAAQNGSSELTMGSIMDGIMDDEADFLHFDEADKILEADEEANDDSDGTSSRHSSSKDDHRETRSSEKSSTPQPTLDSSIQPTGRRLRHKHVCTFCSQGLHSKQRLVQHLRDNHIDQIFHCDVCDEYVDRQDLIVHMTTHALAIENTESINCGTTNTTATGSEPDPPSSTDVPATNKAPAAAAAAPYACDQCPKTFANRGSKRYHMISAHGQQRDFRCEHCDRTFACKRTLTNHIKSIHETARLLTCDDCPKSFKTDTGLYQHRKRLHSESAGSSSGTSSESRCEYCFKKFKFVGDLTRHLTMHTKETKYFCQYCNKGFGVRNNLTKHLRTHSSLLDFKCHICSYAAAQRRYLAEHMKNVHQTVLRTNESA